MPTFRYVAKDKTGKIHRGHMEADNEKMVARQLQESGYWLTEAFLERPKETAGQRQSANTDNAAEPNQQLKQLFIVVGLVLIALAFWMFAR